ncbi:NmrA-like family protein [Paenibacillus sp. 32O-W]|uniref:NmrA family NAD(P)-binding protein n=1 Tax=Paenibacillus sp. 32O-W TaxID=1695218 RepID=UPI00072298B0|nr:NmrA family NAD(P)-binding protein [Paenibacillus sp. 32O-W]ALS28556.1 NmrA-like family protein [Paenibacillus sp. 32O-W]
MTGNGTILVLGATGQQGGARGRGRHFVYSSVGGADRQASFRMAKWDIEQYVRSLKLPATILRPAGFMESCASPFYGIQGGTLAEANGESYDVDIPGLRKLHPGPYDVRKLAEPKRQGTVRRAVPFGADERMTGDYRTFLVTISCF